MKKKETIKFVECVPGLQPYGHGKKKTHFMKNVLPKLPISFINT